MVPNPVHFRYAWGRSPLGNLQAARHSDIPFATQRSDRWPLENTPRLFDRDSPKKLDRGDKRKLVDALKKLDRQRELRRARDLLTELEKKPGN